MQSLPFRNSRRFRYPRMMHPHIVLNDYARSARQFP
jgi:hypothetical protein